MEEQKQTLEQKAENELVRFRGNSQNIHSDPVTKSVNVSTTKLLDRYKFSEISSEAKRNIIEEIRENIRTASIFAGLEESEKGDEISLLMREFDRLVNNRIVNAEQGVLLSWLFYTDSEFFVVEEKGSAKGVEKELQKRKEQFITTLKAIRCPEGRVRDLLSLSNKLHPDVFISPPLYAFLLDNTASFIKQNLEEKSTSDPTCYFHLYLSCLLGLNEKGLSSALTSVLSDNLSLFKNRYKRFLEDEIKNELRKYLLAYNRKIFGYNYMVEVDEFLDYLESSDIRQIEFFRSSTVQQRFNLILSNSELIIKVVPLLLEINKNSGAVGIEEWLGAQTAKCLGKILYYRKKLKEFKKILEKRSSQQVMLRNCYGMMFDNIKKAKQLITNSVASYLKEGNSFLAAYEALDEFYKENIQKQLEGFYKDKRDKEFIRDFFVLWNTAIDDVSTKNILSRLQAQADQIVGITTEIEEKEKKSIASKRTEEVPDIISAESTDIHVDIKLIEFNRILSMGILVSPFKWDESFYRLYVKALDIIENKLDIDNNELHRKLKYDSFSPDVCSRLHFLFFLYEMRYQIENKELMGEVSRLILNIWNIPVSNSFLTLLSRLNLKLPEDNEDKLNAVIKIIRSIIHNSRYWFSVSLHMFQSEEELRKIFSFIIKNGNDLVEILELLVVDYDMHLEIVKGLSEECIKSIGSSLDNLTRVLDVLYFSGDAQLEIIKKLADRNYFELIFKNAADLRKILVRLILSSKAQEKVVDEFIKINLLKEKISEDKINLVLTLLTCAPNVQLKIIERLEKKHLKSSIKDINDLFVVLKTLTSYNAQLKFVEMLGEEYLKSIIKSTDGFSKILLVLNIRRIYNYASTLEEIALDDTNYLIKYRINMHSKLWYGLSAFVTVLGVGAILSGVGIVPLLALATALSVAAIVAGAVLITANAIGSAIIYCKNKNSRKRAIAKFYNDLIIGNKEKKSESELPVSYDEKELAESKQQGQVLDATSQTFFRPGEDQMANDNAHEQGPELVGLGP